MNNDATHRKDFEQYKREIVETRAALGKCILEQEQLETRLAFLQQIAISMAGMLGEVYVPEDAIGLTDAIRQVFRAAPTENLTAPMIRDRLKAMGFDVTQYGNVLASIHTALNRLANVQKEVKPMGNVGNSQAYQWIRPVAKPLTEVKK